MDGWKEERKEGNSRTQEKKSRKEERETDNGQLVVISNPHRKRTLQCGKRRYARNEQIIKIG